MKNAPPSSLFKNLSWVLLPRISFTYYVTRERDARISLFFCEKQNNNFKCYEFWRCAEYLWDVTGHMCCESWCTKLQCKKRYAGNMFHKSCEITVTRVTFTPILGTPFFVIFDMHFTTVLCECWRLHVTRKCWKKFWSKIRMSILLIFLHGSNVNTKLLDIPPKN